MTNNFASENEFEVIEEKPEIHNTNSTHQDPSTLPRSDNTPTIPTTQLQPNTYESLEPKEETSEIKVYKHISPIDAQDRTITSYQESPEHPIEEVNMSTNGQNNRGPIEEYKTPQTITQTYIIDQQSPLTPHTNTVESPKGYIEASSEEGCISISNDSERNMTNNLDIVVTESTQRIHNCSLENSIQMSKLDATNTQQ